MRISDWSSDVCSSDLHVFLILGRLAQLAVPRLIDDDVAGGAGERALAGALDVDIEAVGNFHHREAEGGVHFLAVPVLLDERQLRHKDLLLRSEEHTAELQSLMRSSYAVFCLKQNTI